MLSGWFLVLACANPVNLAAQLLDSQDSRFKCDVLLIVAHPDDETAISSYLARLSLDAGKRIGEAVVTRGTSAPNGHGSENGRAMGMVRDREHREALRRLGIEWTWYLSNDNWSLGQDPLESLGWWPHGAALEEAVRLIRLTRPEVILTFLPALVGDHSEHQASGILAVEAFDLAGDPMAFPEQVAPPQAPGRVGQRREGLTPWQAKRLFFFTDADDLPPIPGPSFAVAEVSPSRAKSYLRLAGESAAAYLTAEEFAPLAQNPADSERQMYAGFPLFPPVVRLIPGKDHVVDARAVSDPFAGLDNGAIGFVAAAPPATDQTGPGLTVELGDPWAFYREFWRRHGLAGLREHIPTRVGVPPSTRVPVWLRIGNGDSRPLSATLDARLPGGWQLVDPDRSAFTVGARQTAHLRVLLSAPEETSPSWKIATFSVRAAGQTAQTTLALQVRKVGIPF